MNNRKVLIALVVFWLIIISAAAFYFLGIFRFLDVIPRETYQASFYTSRSKLHFQYLSVFAIVNGLIVFAGLRSTNVASTLLRFIDPVLLLLGTIALVVAKFIPCEGLSCIGSGFLFLGGAAILGSVLVQYPLVWLVSKGVNKLVVGVITVLFMLTIILVPLQKIYRKRPKKVFRKQRKTCVLQFLSLLTYRQRKLINNSKE